MQDQIYLEQRYKRSVTKLFKEMIRIIEDMRADHNFHYARLYEILPPEHHDVLRAADHFDEQKFNWIRKRILDVGNDSLREFSADLENFSVSFIFKQQ